MKKRLISWITAAAVSLMQLMPSAVIIAHAAELEAAVSLSEESGDPGDTVKLNLTLDKNPGLDSMVVFFKYNTDVLECTAIDEKGMFGINESPTDTKYYSSDLYDKTTKLPNEKVKMGWVPVSRVSDTGLLAELSFKIKENAYGGEYAVELSTSQADNFQVDYSYDDLTDPAAWTDVELKLTNGTITVTGDKPPYDGEISAPPVISNETASGFDVAVSEGCEYTYSTEKITNFTDCVWYTAERVTGLYPGTKYYVYQRAAETASHQASEPSEAAEAVTLKISISDVIESVSIGDEGSIDTVLVPVITYKDGYSEKYLGNITYSWDGTSSSDPDLLAAESYKVTLADANEKCEIRVALAGDKCNDIAYSNYVTAGKKKPLPPEEPIIKDRTADGFTLGAMAGYEYIISDGNSTDGKAWTALDNDVVIDGLSPNDTRYIFVRRSETDDTNASAAASATVRINNNDADLASLTLSDGVLSPAFSADVTDYTVKMPYGSKVPTVTAVANDINANVQITQAVDFVYNNTATVTVTAENGYDTKTYTVAFTEIDATLSNLTVNNVTVSGFSPTKTEYTYSIPYVQWAAAKDRIYTINATASKSTSNVEINDNGFALESVNSDIVSSKTVNITVTTADDKTVYTIIFKVDACLHSDKDIQTVQPTCTELGKHNTVCITCGKIISSEEIPALGHDFGRGEVTVEPGCTTEGITVYRCSRCNYEHERKTAPLGHVQGEVTETKATCTDDGRISVRCGRCFEEISSEIINATGHNWNAWYKAGDTRYERNCLICGELEFADVPFPDDHEHNFNGTIDVTDPTCTSEGLRVIHCSFENCGAVLTETIAKVAHTHGNETTVPASCITDGSRTVYCADCGTPISKTVIPASGHSFTNYTDTATCTASGFRTAYCDNGCGAVDSEPTSAKGHNYGRWLNGGAEGHYRVCAECGSESDIIGHNSDGGKVTIQPTETQEGERTFTCKDCGYVIGTETIEKVKPDHIHSFSKSWSYDATGHWHECSCGKETADFAVHRMNSGVTTIAPTEIAAGLKTYSCTICNYTITETIPPTGIPDTNYSENPYLPVFPVYTPSSDTKNEPYVQNRTTVSGWNEIIQTLKRTKDGKTVTVEMNGTTILPKKALQTIRDENVTLALVMGNGLIWKINGLNVTKPKKVDMGAVMQEHDTAPGIRGIETAEKLYRLTLAHDGEFGFTADLYADVGERYNDYTADLYYYSGSGKLDFMSQDTVLEGIAEFEFTHASDYLIALSSGNSLYEDVSASAGTTASESPIDISMPMNGGVQLPTVIIPKDLKLSNKKRKYRILRKRRIDDLVFVF